MRYVTIILFLFICGKTFSCDCGYFGGFAYSNQLTDLVVYGEVIEYDSIITYDDHSFPYSMKFRIIEKLRGLEHSDTITVFGDNGIECRPYINTFKPNSKWILALDNYDSEYEISICGEFYLEVKDNKIKGDIFGKTYDTNEIELDYSMIKDIVNSPLKYPILNDIKTVNKTDDGIIYIKGCDDLPIPPIPIDSLNQFVNNCIDKRTLNIGDSYLFLTKIIIDTNDDFIYNGIYQINSLHDNQIKNLSDQIESILKKQSGWRSGKDNTKQERCQIVIPILIKK